MKANQLPSIDATTFFVHLNKLHHIWENSYKKDFGSLLVINPKEEGANNKAMALIGWMLGFSLNETTLLFTQKELVIFASEKKSNPQNIQSICCWRSMIMWAKRKDPSFS